MHRGEKPRHGGRRRKGASEPTGSGAHPGARRRPWFFRLLALTVVPILALAAVELALRLAGFGYPTCFFIRTQIGGRTVYVENEEFGFRFFPRVLARSPSPVVLEARKATNTHRIFLLGESAALGDPDPAYGFGRYLQVLLEERYPGHRFEVVCAAMTAINSHAILPIARECARHEGDFWILYMGNNEMEGPFGAGTIFGPQAPGRNFVRASLALRTTRIGQGLEALLTRVFRDRAAPRSWSGIGMFLGHQTRHDDPAHARVYESFRENLEEILRTGRRAGAKIILSTVASNLKDCPPFASLHAAGLNDAGRQTWEQLFHEGNALELLGKFPEAADTYRQAEKLDPDFADLQYRMGTCCWAMTNLAEARRCFERARDLDALPFRADSRINEIIRDAAARFAGEGVRALDAVSVLSPPGSPGIPGEESFFEHVHLNFEGNYRMARALAQEIAAQLPEPVTRAGRAEWATPENCARRLSLTTWNRYQVWETVARRVSQAPFTHQYNALVRQNTLRDRMSRLKEGMNAAGFREAREVCRQAVAGAPDDYYLHRKYAEVLELGGDGPGAVKEWLQVRDLLPHHPIAYYQLGRLQAAQGKDTEAAENLEQALRIRSDFAEALDELGRVRAKQGRFEESLARLHEALRLEPEEATFHVHLADALAAQGKRDQGLAELREAVRLRPAYWEARYLLGVELALREKVKEAREQFAEVVRLRPEYALGHLNLGVALAREGQWKEAEAEFRETLRLDPRNPSAQQHLAQLQGLKNLRR